MLDYGAGGTGDDSNGVVYATNVSAPMESFYKGWSASSVETANPGPDGAGYIDLNKTSLEDDVDTVFVASIVPITRTYIDRLVFSLAGAQWGSSVDIVGDNVFLGAQGKSRVAVYDVSSGQSEYTKWTTTIGSFTDFATKPVFMNDKTGLLGSEMAAVSATQFFAGAPTGNNSDGVIYPYLKSGSTWTVGSGIVAQQASAAADSFGADNTVDTAGNFLLIGAPGVNQAYLYTVSGNPQGNTLIPYRYNAASLAMENDTNGLLKFGAGSQLISNGFDIVGTNNTDIVLNKLYSFRQRGPVWTTAAVDLVPQALAMAKGGTSVAVDGNTAVVGASEFDNRGAVFVYTADAAGNWTFSAQLQGADTRLNDGFGAAVALSGDSLIVGAPNKGISAGAVYLFQRVGNTWSQVSEFAGGGSQRQAGQCGRHLWNQRGRRCGRREQGLPL